MPIIGKWRAIELYSGLPQGCYCWGQIPPMHADIIEFSFSGKYQITKPSFSSSVSCPGTYQILNDSTILLATDCGLPNPGPVATGIYSQSLKQLTIEYNYPSFGIIKYKYVKL